MQSSETKSEEDEEEGYQKNNTDQRSPDSFGASTHYFNLQQIKVQQSGPTPGKQESPGPPRHIARAKPPSNPQMVAAPNTSVFNQQIQEQPPDKATEFFEQLCERVNGKLQAIDQVKRHIMHHEEQLRKLHKILDRSAEILKREVIDDYEAEDAFNTQFLLDGLQDSLNEMRHLKQ